MRAVLLGQRDEVRRRDEAARRVVPAGERLEAGQRLAVERDDRLVVDVDLVALDRAQQLALELEALDAPRPASTPRRPRGGPCPGPWRGTSRRRPGAAAPTRRGARRRCRPTRSTKTSRPWTTTGARSASADPLGHDARPPPVPARSSSRTANSSPPRRAAVSALRSESSMRRATATSSSSPAAWPSESLTVLKRSRSRKITPQDVPRRRPRVSACCRRSVNSARLGSPVSASCSAWWSMVSTRRASVSARLACSAKDDSMSCSARENTRPARNDDRMRLPITRPSSCTGAAIAAVTPSATKPPMASGRAAVVLGDDEPALGHRAPRDAVAHAAMAQLRGLHRPRSRARRRR